MTCDRSVERAPDDRRRDRGSATVTALVLMFAFTAGGVIWLSRDVNRRVSNRSAAQSIAFQAARAGAQQIQVGDLRDGGVVDVVVNVEAAGREARIAANRLFGSYQVDGSVQDVDVARETVTVAVVLRDPAGDVTGIASAEAQTGP